MSLVLPNLYIGGEENAKDFEWLKYRGITHIVNCARELKPHFPNEFEYINLASEDVHTYNLNDAFFRSHKFINQSLEAGGTVLVHCSQGISRSSSIVCYYMMHELEMSAKEALYFLKESHPIARPNQGFFSQLYCPF